MTHTITQSTAQPLAKIALITAAGLIMTFVAFAFMQYLIKPQENYAPTVQPDFTIEVAQEKKIKQITTISRLPPPPMVNKAPPKLMPVSDAPEIDTTQIIPLIKISPQMSDKEGLTSLKLDNQASPIVRMAPKYPQSAARDGIEGWVQIGFSISKTGRVINPTILASEPKRIFDAAALKAIKKWKYKAKIEQGHAIEQHGLNIQLDFSLDNSN
ncbi:energy transducer TonB [Pseudoalteromonas tunicata]|jgi:protein TonB|uniref:Protein TonB n=1 Tax=Pseudoalteromonas tunicata D2 TaxID=87626 RepID=A4CCF2_9GAMM|nr:energy transducer TonB [Pseudoalteromonas tunicata]ATC93750.1 periplasmic protein TonB [Pseudoalteromonas tunicata]AXT29573.1 energy transducer TonB [Pseudoalteromonas tunicata]EAR27245.1 TonB-like periplasmic protein [Pseudoalteromonas tunicata D2]